MKRELAELEEGGIFATIGIKNFLEADYFAWYLDEWDDEIATRIHEISTALMNFEPATVELKPERVKDLFKHLYQNLVPGKNAGEKADVRGKLGEFYTPDWLAELLMDETSYSGDPDKTVLDPACGSGTFLVMAIKRIRQYAETNFLDQRTLVTKIIQNVRGIDLNPLAVLATKANYLIALSDLLRYRPPEGIELPVYLADSISVVKLESEAGNPEFELKTNEGRFWIAEEIIEKKLLYPMLTFLSESVNNGLTRDEFRKALKKRFTLTDSTIDSFERLYKKISDLERVKKNRIWTSLLKNSFSPLLIGKFDFIIGNPPWINWEGLPERYRESTKYLWEDYQILGSSQGAIKQDISMLFLIRCLDLYCNDEGRLGFLMPFTIFKTKSGSGFRRVLSQKHHVLKADDLVELYPFEGAVNRTSSIVVDKKGSSLFPIACRMWMNPDANSIGPDSDLSTVIKLSKQYPTLLVPVEEKSPDSAWMEVSQSVHSVLRKVMRPSSYKAYEGTLTGADGIYLVKVLRREGSRAVVENLASTSKKEVKKVTVPVEASLLHPIVRGRDVQRWFSRPEFEIIATHDATDGAVISESAMKIDYPMTYSYLLSFKPNLSRRQIKPFLGSKKKSLPFYTLDNIGERNFANHKVVWKHISGKVSGKAALECAVISPTDGTSTMTTHGLMYIPFKDENEAHYVCAILNSSIARLVVMSYALEVHVTTDVVDYVHVPDYNKNNALHQKLASLSREAHHVANSTAAVPHGLNEKLQLIEKEIDETVSDLYGLTEAENAEVIQSLRVVSGMDKTQKRIEETADED